MDTDQDQDQDQDHLDFIGVSLEGTNIPAIDEILDAVFENQPPFIGIDEVEHHYFAPFFKRNICPLNNLIISRQTVVEQEAVSSGFCDLQGICWREGEQGKKAYRRYRDSVTSSVHMHYSGPVIIEENREALDYKDNDFYRFRYTDTSIHCSHRHPQLRNLVSATSKNDIYYLNHNSIMHWSPQLRTARTILGDPLKKPFTRVPSQITTLAALDNMIMLGGMDGNFTFMNLQTCMNPIRSSITDVEVNAIEMSLSRTGDPHAYFSTNDREIRCMDLRTLEQKATFPTGWFVNYTSQSPDGHMIALVGDDLDGEVMSVNSREKIATLTGHQRYSFSVAWSPDSTHLATGSDDRSTCIYDTRMMNKPIHILGADIRESVRSLRYSSCGRYLVMAEESNYVHIVDTASDYTKAQKIDFVGDISGISLTPDAESLFIGVSYVDFSSILEFEVVHQRGELMNMDDPWASMYC
ncbi:hypothetical protein EMPS_06256 [Entomortierella parvispora]|uniref:DUF2415 domain-containing protein n=1 Tax=Entomortierella parvispora TaxID=205924 RepID=A0A9P3LXA4_9FUNG|nr:hypothetical protein EMPS_06256 [Entomortierella parvispora]